MIAHAETSLVSLAQRFAPRKVELSLFKIPLDLKTSDYHEEVTFRAAALVKSNVVGAETEDDLAPLGASLHHGSRPRYKGRFSIKYLEPMEKARQLAKQIWDDGGAGMTLKELQAQLKERHDALVTVDPSWPLEEACLDYLIQSGAELRMWEDIMGWMPKQNREVAVVDALARFIEYESGATYACLPLSLRSTFGAAKAFLSAVHRGLAPHMIEESQGNMKIFAERSLGPI